MSDLLTPKEPRRSYTAEDVKSALRDHYPAAEYGMAFEVAQGTGFAAHRHLDVLVMSLWPSRGLTIIGIEVKISRGDWRREKSNPQKAEELARFCDYFFVAAPKDVIPVAEVPEGWGLLEVCGEKIRQAKAAAKHQAEPIGRPFVASLFRSASRPADKDDAIKTRKIDERLRKEYDERAKRDLVTRERGAIADAEKWRELVSGLGQTYIDVASVKSALALVYKSGIVGPYNIVENLRNTLAYMLKCADDAMAAFKATDDVPAAPGTQGRQDVTKT
jgi:hypothetical protein